MLVYFWYLNITHTRVVRVLNHSKQLRVRHTYEMGVSITSLPLYRFFDFFGPHDSMKRRAVNQRTRGILKGPFLAECFFLCSLKHFVDCPSWLILDNKLKSCSRNYSNLYLVVNYNNCQMLTAESMSMNFKICYLCDTILFLISKN